MKVITLRIQELTNLIVKQLGLSPEFGTKHLLDIYEIPFEPTPFVTKQVPPDLSLDRKRSLFGKTVFYKVCEITDMSRRVVIPI